METLLIVILVVAVFVWRLRAIRRRGAAPSEQFMRAAFGFRDMDHLYDAAALAARAGVDRSQVRDHYTYLVDSYGQDAVDRVARLIRNAEFDREFPNTKLEGALSKLTNGPTTPPLNENVAAANATDQHSQDLRPDSSALSHGIVVPGGDAQITIPPVSFATFGSDAERKRLFLTAVSGAANLLIPIVQQRTFGALPLPTLRGCALDMVLTGHQLNLAPTQNTEGLFVAGRTMFETRWREWSEHGDPVVVVRAKYERSVAQS